MSGLGKAYQDAVNEIENIIQKEIEEKFCDRKYVNYAAYDSDEYDIPINNLNDIPITGKVRFVNEEFDSGVFENPTWLDIAVIANRMLFDTAEYLNVYLEDVEAIKHEDGVTTAIFHMGS